MLNLRRFLFLLAATCGLLPAATGRVAAQDNNSPPSVGDVVSAIGQSVGAMFSDLLTPYQPPAAFADVYADIPHSRAADGAFILGDPNAPITLVVFADWACPHCQEYKPIVDQFIADYVRSGQAALEVRMFPTAGGQLTVDAAELAECADDQRSGAFWSASEALYALAESGNYATDLAGALAQKLDLDYAKLQSCQPTATQVQTDYNFAVQAGVNGTPAVMVRHAGGPPSYISRGDRTYDGGGVPFDVLQFIMEGGSGTVA